MMIDNQELQNNEEIIQKIRGKKIGFVFQDPQTSLNPLFKIKDQLIETIQTHLNLSSDEALKRSINLLLEAGGKDNYHWIHIPIGYLYCIGNPKVDWMYNTVEEKGLGNRSIDYPRGKVLGGCSSINGMIYMRGQARDYDLWRQLGGEGWGWDDVKPYFLKSENYHKDIPGHSQKGEMRVEKPRISWEILNSVQKAAEEIGIPKTEDFNQGNNEGSGYFDVMQKKGVRWSAARAFLKPVIHRKNLHVITHAQVVRLEINNSAVKGVIYKKGGYIFKANALNEVILSAGSIGSPQIMMLSGLGDGNEIKEHGIQLTKIYNVDCTNILKNNLNIRK